MQDGEEDEEQAVEDEDEGVDESGTKSFTGLETPETVVLRRDRPAPAQQLYTVLPTVSVCLVPHPHTSRMMMNAPRITDIYTYMFYCPMCGMCRLALVARWLVRPIAIKCRALESESSCSRATRLIRST
jgi:hypothetical protein